MSSTGCWRSRRASGIWRSVWCVAASLAVCSCAPGPQRLTPPARHDGALYHMARRADALSLTPTGSFSTGFPRVVDVANALGNVAPQRHRPVRDTRRTVPPASSATAGGVARGAPGEAGTPSGDPPPGADTAPTMEAASHPVSPYETAPALTAADRAWLDGVLERYAPEIADVWEDEFQSTFVAPFDDPRLRFYYVDETVRFYNEQGRDFEHGANFYLSNRSTVRLFDRLLVTATPEFSVVENGKAPRNSDTDVRLRFQELTASARLGPAEFTVGRTPLWWGPGRHGSLLLSNNAPAFDLVKVGTAGPQLLPGFLGYLGFIQAEVFASRLDSARPVDRPYLAGMRVSSRVLPFLEIGASRTAMFGGGDRSVDPGTVWNVITAQNENDADDPGDQLASIDARVIVPWALQPLELYGEFGGEDEAGGFFSKNAYLLGVYLPRVGPWHALELTFELTNTTVSGEDRIWYTNRNFPDGYTFHNQVIGHHVGTDGLDVFVEARFHPTAEVTVFASYDYEEHFRRDPVEERLHQVRVGAEARVWKGLWLSAFFGVDLWENFQQSRGREERGHVAGMSSHWEF